MKEPKARKQAQIQAMPGGFTRTRHAKLVQWRCEWCSTEHEEWRYPGPAPRYCEGCKKEAQNQMEAAAIRRKRTTGARKRQETP